MIDLVLILAIKLGLYLAARAALPFLFGQARHASLDVSAKSTATLPTPATAHSSSQTTPLFSDSIHDDDDNDNGDQFSHRVGGRTATDRSPFLAFNKGSVLPSWPQLTASLLTPVRIRNSQGSLDLASLAALLFSLAFAESASLFVAVLLETAGFPAGNATTLRQVWRFDLAAVQTLVIVLIPLAVCLLFTYRSNASTPLARRIVYLLIPFLPWLVLFFKVPLPAALLDSSSGAGIFDGLLARTAVIGVTFIAVLSGSAALQAAWEAAEQFQGKQQRPPSPSDIRLAQESFQRTCSDLSSRKTDLARLESDPANTNAGWSVSNLWGGDSRSREIKSLKSEIFGLSSIASAMRDDLDRMTSLQHKEQLSSTIVGKLWILVGWLWAAYCAFRIALSLLNLLILGYRDTAPPDFISLSLAYLIRIFDVDLDIAVWTKQVSLLFVGVLIWGRIGSVLGYLGSAFRAAGTGVSSSFLVLFLAEIMTIYLLATLIQLRSSLPASVTPPASPRDLQHDPTSPPLLATLPSFQVVFGSLFDSAFLIAAAVTAGWKYLMYMQRTSSGDGGVLFGGGR